MKLGLHLDNGSCHDVQALLAEWRDMVRLADQHDFDYVSVVDHLVPFPDFRARDLPLLDPWQLLTVFAAITSKVTLFTLVCNGSLRHPVSIAKQLASLDAISGGRVVFGVGAGGYTLDEAALGIAARTGQERYARLEECIRLVRHLTSGAVTSFRGEYYEIADYLCAPGLTSAPPVLVAGKSGRIMSIAAQEAQAINFAFATEAELEVLLQSLEDSLLRESRTLEGFEVTLLDRVFLSEAAWQAAGSPVVNGHRGLVGSAAELVQSIRRLEAASVDTLFCMFPDLQSLQSFVHDVLPECS